MVNPIMPLPPEQAAALKNVGSPYNLIDTIGVMADLEDLGQQPPGWFSSFYDAGAVQTWNFFNMRTRADTGLAYNNQEARDATTYVYLIHGISVAFAAPTMPQLGTSDIQDGLSSALWMNEIPQNSAFALKIQQDERLVLNCLMPGSGNGPTGGGYAQLMSDGSTSTGIEYALAHTAGSQGVSMLKNTWPFPRPLAVPRQASLSVSIELSEWARNLLQALPGPYRYRVFDAESENYVQKSALFLCQITLIGQRAVQKRGEYHR